MERYRKCSAISSIQRFSKDELRFAKMLSQGQLTEAEDWKIDCSKTKHGPSESLVALAKWIKVIFKMKSIEPLWTISLCGQSSFFDMRLVCRCRCKKKKTRRCHQDLCRSLFWIFLSKIRLCAIGWTQKTMRVNLVKLIRDSVNFLWSFIAISTKNNESSDFFGPGNGSIHTSKHTKRRRPSILSSLFSHFR